MPQKSSTQNSQAIPKLIPQKSASLKAQATQEKVPQKSPQKYTSLTPQSIQNKCNQILSYKSSNYKGTNSTNVSKILNY